MTFFAMEQPQSQDIWAIKDAKNKCLRCVQPASPEATVLATHEDGGSEPTFVQTVLKINSDRWEGVPFIIKCGEGLNENKLEIRVQFQENCGEIFDNTVQNELVFRIHPNEAMYMKMQIKQPGVTFNPQQTFLDLTYSHKIPSASTSPNTKEQLILNVLDNQTTCFLQSGEFAEASRIFDPLFYNQQLPMYSYEEGSRGPVSLCM
eukprot:m.115667 g.115667  ORF g.115667 m.115667 type:complete len:205 (+) comp12842_c1_seq26:72-686(+)